MQYGTHENTGQPQMNSAAPLATANESYASIDARRLSLEALWHRGCCLATFLKQQGVKEDSAVAILMRNDLSFLESMIAISVLGAYAVPLNWHLTGPEIKYILEDSGALMLMAHADLYRPVAQFVPSKEQCVIARTPEEISGPYRIHADQCEVPAGIVNLDDAINVSQPQLDRSRVGSRNSIVYTSGTTGRPKGVRKLPLPAVEARKYAQLSQLWFDLKPDVRTVMAGPMYHSAPNTYTRQVLNSGGSITLMARFDAEELLAVIERDRITHLHLVPIMMVRLLRLPEEVKKRHDLSSLQFVIHGAAPISVETKRAFIEWWGPVIYEYYGSTEAGMISRSSTEEWLERPGTVGKAWPGREVRIYSESGEILAPGTVGDVYADLQGVPNFTYQNADAQRLEIGRDGLITNGDVGYLDEDGYLFLVDRKNDIVISGGVNIYPAEIECALIEHTAVADCAVIGIPDEEFGEKLLAFVKPRPGETLSQAELTTYLRGKLAGLKVPKEFVFTDSLPRDDSGKLMKRKLRDPYWAGRSRMI